MSVLMIPSPCAAGFAPALMARTMAMSAAINKRIFTARGDPSAVRSLSVLRAASMRLILTIVVAEAVVSAAAMAPAAANRGPSLVPAAENATPAAPAGAAPTRTARRPRDALMQAREEANSCSALRRRSRSTGRRERTRTSDDARWREAACP